MTTIMSGSHLILLSILLLYCTTGSESFIFSLKGLVACHPRHIQVLTQFKNEFDTRGCNHSDYSNGVWCDNSTGAVTKLKLTACLSGPLKSNSSLFQFHELRWLDLSHNSFTPSAVLSEFGNLNKLEVLDLSYNGFLGQIHSSFSNLSSLSALKLSYNHFSGPLNPNSSLFRLHHLTYLDLGYNNFSSSLPSEFGNLNKLEVLSLYSNVFIGQIPFSISNLSRLNELYLDHNQLTGSFPLVRNLTKLSILELSSNHFSGKLISSSSLFELHNLSYLNLGFNNFSSSLPSEFGNLNKLELLCLSSNGFFGQVPPTISNLSRLNKLYLDHNKLTGSFTVLVQNLTKLSAVRLSNNHFTGTIPSSFLTMPFLTRLDLNENYLTGSIEVPNSSFSTRLVLLVLGKNHFERKIIEPISKLINLTDLDLSFLNTSDLIDLNLFSSLKSLLSLDLSGNNISPASLSSDSYIPLTLEELILKHCGITEFPNILKTLQKLEYIELSNNIIKGKIPEWLWNLPRLIALQIGNNSFDGFEGSAEVLVNSTSMLLLDLDKNSFEGALPNLPLSITVFSANSNSFTGEIPLSICSRSSLAALDLSNNNFTGQIPQCLSKLMFLNLRKNNLEGSIPDTFYTDFSLQSLDVGYNRLTGKLPRSLLNCSSLRFLSVDNNRIKDTFPFWLKALPNLRVLTLSSNKFYGPISLPHQGPIGFPELRILEISGNKFNGSLPPNYFENWKASSLTMNQYGGLYMIYTRNAYGIISYTYEDFMDLQYKGLSMEQKNVLTSYNAIDFSGNLLHGQIPQSIGLLKALIALNFSNNAFIGHIPLSLSNLTELESLDLSSNQLSGTIPNGLGTLSFLAYINVSHNQLKGEIPQGTQITSQHKSSFEGNAGLCGLPLEESCFGSNAPPTRQPEEEEEEEEEEQVLKWKAVAIGYGSGVLFGLAVAQLIASYKPEWLAKMIGQNKRRNC